MLCNTCSHCAVCIHRASIKIPSCLSNIQFDCSFYSGNQPTLKEAPNRRSREEIQQELLASRPVSDENENSQFGPFEQEYECEVCHEDVPSDETVEHEGKMYCNKCIKEAIK